MSGDDFHDGFNFAKIVNEIIRGDSGEDDLACEHKFMWSSNEMTANSYDRDKFQSKPDDWNESENSSQKFNQDWQTVDASQIGETNQRGELPPPGFIGHREASGNTADMTAQKLEIFQPTNSEGDGITMRTTTNLNELYDDINATFSTNLAHHVVNREALMDVNEHHEVDEGQQECVDQVDGESKLKPIDTRRRFPCPHCDLILTTRPNRRKHIMIHTGERPFVCDVCGVGKITRTELKRHTITHTRRKEHFCGVCGNAYFCLNTVKRHVLGVHKISPDNVQLYRVKNFQDKTTGQEMIKIKVVKRGKNYNSCFRVF